MIEHIVHFFKAEFSYTWHLNLPFRIVKGDEIHYELLINRGELQYDKELSDEFIFNSYFRNHKIDSGDTLVVIGYKENLDKFDKYVRSRY